MLSTPPDGAGTVKVGGAHQPGTPDFWKSQWKWHTSWLQKHSAYRQAIAAKAQHQQQALPSPGVLTGLASAPALGSAAAAAEGVDAAEPNCLEEPNSLEERMWPNLTVRRCISWCACVRCAYPRALLPNLPSLHSFRWRVCRSRAPSSRGKALPCSTWGW